MMHLKGIMLFLVGLTTTILLESCSHQKAVSEQTSPATTSITQSNSVPLPLQVQVSQARYKTYDSSEELSAASGLVIVGRSQTPLEDSKPISIPESEKSKYVHTINDSVVVKDKQGFVVDSYTITSVKVQKVVKGKTEEKEIRVLQPVAVVQEPNKPPFISLVEGYSPLQKNVKYLLFLKEVDTETYPNLAGVYSILSVNQGKFNFDKLDKGETTIEGENEQYRQLKAKVRGKYQPIVDVVP
jgi:hypothetical protein